MILLQNGAWKNSFAEDGIHIPSVVKLLTIAALLFCSFLLGGCSDPLQSDSSVTDDWYQLFRTDSRAPVAGMAFSPNGELLVAVWGKGIYRYTETLGYFAQTGASTLADNSFTELHVDTLVGFIYAGTFNGTLYRSTDSGLTWKNISPTFNRKPGFLSCIVGIGSTPSHKLFVAYTHEGILESTDFGTTWTTVLDPPSIDGITTMTVTAQDIIFAGTASAGLYVGDFFETNQFWMVTTNFDLMASCVEADSSGTAYFGFNNGSVYKWGREGFVDSISIGANNGRIMDIAVSKGRKVYIATEYKGVHAGQGADSLNVALFDPRVRTLIIDKNGYLYAGTSNEGVFRSVFPVHFYEAKLESK